MTYSLQPFLSIRDLHNDGFKALQETIKASPYKTIEQAVAALTLFTHPETVAQTKGQPVFKTIRKMAKRGQVEMQDGNLIGFDDNKSPTDAFLWSNALPRLRDIQYNHIYSLSSDYRAYTNLANICATPSFLSKLTDTHSSIKELLQFRAYDLYQWIPETVLEAPKEPRMYRRIIWCEPLPAVTDVQLVLLKHISRRKDRTARICKETDWLLGESLKA